MWAVDLDWETRRHYKMSFVEPLFEARHELPTTPPAPGPELELPLVHAPSGERVLLVFRDLGGEVFQRRERLDEIGFLRYASGVVLMADPLAFPSPAASSDTVRAWSMHGYQNAVEVLGTYRQWLLDTLREASDRQLPFAPSDKALAVAIPKADLVLPDGHWFLDDNQKDRCDPRASGFWHCRQQESESTREWVASHLGSELVDLTADFGATGWFFLSNFGYPHPPHTPPAEKPRPRRVEEPILALLDHLLAKQPPTAKRVRVAAGDEVL